MLNAYLPSRSRGKVVDIRPQGVANQHMSKGKGWVWSGGVVFQCHAPPPCIGGGVESPAHYPQWKVEHAKFESPTVIQASFCKLIDGVYCMCMWHRVHWHGGGGMYCINEVVFVARCPL